MNGFTIIKNKPIAVRLVTEQLNKSVVGKGLAKLKKIYAKLPKTKCLKCGECCSWYRVKPVYSIEYLNILNYIKKQFPQDDIPRFYILAKMNLGIEQRYKDTKKKPPRNWRPCIFFDTENKICRIHKCKPFVCRVYGLGKFNNPKKLKSLFPKCTLPNKKDRKMLKPEIIDSFWKEINALSTLYILNSKKDIVTTKSQDLNNWFLG